MSKRIKAKSAAKPQKPQAVEQVVQNDTPAVEVPTKTEPASAMALVIDALRRGDVMGSYTLLNKHKAEKNHTVVVICDAGDGESLCEIKKEYRG